MIMAAGSYLERIKNCLEEEGKGLRKAEDTVLYILLTINHLQDINAMEFLTSSVKPGINCCGWGSKRQIQIIRHNHKQSACGVWPEKSTISP